MGAAVIAGIPFYGIPLGPQVMTRGRHVGTKHRNKESKQLAPLSRVCPLTPRRQQLMIAAIRRGVLRIARSLFLPKKLRDEERQRHRDALEMALLVAAASWKPRFFGHDGRKARFITYAITVLKHGVYAAHYSLKTDAYISNLHEAKDGTLPNLDFVPDLRTIPPRFEMADLDLISMDEWQIDLDRPTRKTGETRAREIFIRRVLHGETLRSLAKMFGVTKERVRQISESFKRKIRDQLLSRIAESQRLHVRRSDDR